MTLNIPTSLSQRNRRRPPQQGFQRRPQFWNWNIPMKPGLSSSHSRLSSITSYATCIIFGNWKGLKSIGCVFDYVLIMNEESQLLSGSRSTSDTGTRSNMNPLTMVQQGMSLFVHMKNFHGRKREEAVIFSKLGTIQFAKIIKLFNVLVQGSISTIALAQEYCLASPSEYIGNDQIIGFPLLRLEQ